MDVPRAIFDKVKHNQPIAIEARVVLPEHIHAIWRLPEVTRPSDWPFSTFHQYVRKGILPENWADKLCFEEMGAGES